jgi:serine/threonine protein kinase
MLSTEGELKIMDFGIAKTAAQFGRTLTGTIKGKLGYMAPEQAAGQVATAASDQFSLGIVLWELATRQRLFTGKTDADIIQAVKLCQIPDLGLMRPDIPSAIRRVIMRMLAENPKDRFQGLQWVQEACMQARIKIEGKGASTLKDFARMHHMLALKQLSQQNWSLAAGNIPSVGTRVISGRKKTSSQVQRFTEKLFPIWVQNFTWKNIFPMTLNFIKKNAQAILKALLWGAMPASVLLFYLDNMHPGIAQELFYGVAFVNIDSPLTPLDVYNGEEYLGTTPVKNLNLPANDIELQLKHPSTHKMMEYPVHLKDEQKYYFIIGEKEIKLLR